jgi:RecB family exonuclease
VQGNIVHSVIAEWQRSPQPIAPLFERIFSETCRKENVRPGYRTEALRGQMLRDLERFAADTSFPTSAGTRVELPFQFEVEGEVAVRGRIDRLDRTDDGRAHVTDYKYSKKASEYARSPDRLQGPFYLLAVEKAFGLEPGGMMYCGLRGGVQYIKQPVTRERLDAALETTLRVIGEVREGNAAPRPADLARCAYCSLKDVCRYEAAEAVLATTEGA